MKRILAISLALAVTSVSAAEWVLVARFDDAQHHVDVTNIQKSGPIRRFWEMVDYRSPDKGALSLVNQIEVNCDMLETRLLYVVTYSGHKASGQALSSTDFRPGTWLPNPPDTVGRTRASFVCSK